jgi:hypothetical protein
VTNVTSDKRFELFDMNHKLLCGNIVVERERESAMWEYRSRERESAMWEYSSKKRARESGKNRASSGLTFVMIQENLIPP